MSRSSLYAWARGPINNANRAGLKGRACRQPLSNGTGSVSVPFILILAEGRMMKFFKYNMTLELKLNLCHVKYRYSQLTESNAFTASRLRTIDLSLFLLIYSIKCSARLTLSCVYFWGTLSGLHLLCLELYFLIFLRLSRYIVYSLNLKSKWVCTSCTRIYLCPP